MLAPAIIIAVFILLLSIPVGVRTEYGDERFSLCARVFVKDIPVFPAKPKTKAEKKTGKSGEPNKLISKLGFGLEEWLEVLKIALRVLGKLKRKLRVDKLYVRFTAGDPDPCTTASKYNAVNALINSLLPFLQRVFIVRKKDISIAADYSLEKSSIDMEAVLTLRVGRILICLISAGYAVLKLIIRNRMAQRRERKDSSGK
mgnify:CR=1 FL=1